MRFNSAFQHLCVFIPANTPNHEAVFLRKPQGQGDDRGRQQFAMEAFSRSAL